ncbi:MAG TPA: DUF488 domain-containing protein [Microbacteriaceae bacterium]|nr:DUF488 domain-containing protein [Microbacteriaceae bacterium]
MPQEVFTIGHSTRTIEEFTALLHGSGIEVLADVRTVPRSRHNPQFAEDELRSSIPAAGIDYERMPGLGGLRYTRKADATGLNDGWRNASFRHYADYMQTGAFADALAGLVARVREHTVAIMCAEAVPWRCHRSLIGDALLVRGFAVRDIMGPTSVKPHTLTRFARVDGLTITYPSAEPLPGAD